LVKQSSAKWRFYLFTSFGLIGSILVFAVVFLFVAFGKQWEAINWVYQNEGCITVEGSQYDILAPMCSTVTGVDLADVDVKNLEPLTYLPELEAIDLQGSRVANFQALSIIPKLRKLELQNSSIQSLSELGRLEKLETLIISGTSVSDLEGLDQFPNLRFLDVCQTEIKDIRRWPQTNEHSLLFIKTDPPVRAKKTDTLFKD